VLTSTRLGDDLSLPQSSCKKNLTQGIVDLVTSGVIEILSLQPDVRSASMLSQSFSQM
jgi:hypothetical protein